MKALEQRIADIEDRQAIADLCARYFFCIDDRDMDAICGMFTPDGSFGSADGAMMATGRRAVVDQFMGRFATMGASNHVGHNLREYARALGTIDRNRAGPTAKPADFPERRPTWNEYRPGLA